jgi:RHS repeat-associated protein
VPFDPAQLIQGFSGTASDQAPSGERNWYIADHLGGTSMLLDGGGSVSSEVVYYPYGLTRYEQNGGEARYRFTGKELDASGLYYFEARYYDALTGRFVSVDPLFTEQPTKARTNTQLLHTYAYALNNPLQYNDYLGLSPNSKTDPTTYNVKAPDLATFIKRAQRLKVEMKTKNPETGKIEPKMVPIPVTTLKYSYHYDLDKSGRLRNVTTKLDYEIHLPRWIKPSSTGPKTRNEYRRGMNAIKKHEYKHVSIAEEELSKAESALEGLTVKAAKHKWSEIVSDFQTAQDDFDAETGHGLTAPGEDSTYFDISSPNEE